MQRIPSTTPPTGSPRALMQWLLQDMVSRHATELHLKVPAPPTVRVGDDLSPVREIAPLTPASLDDLCSGLGQLAGAEFLGQKGQDIRLSFGLPGLGRFHALIYRQRGTRAVLVLRMGTEVPDLSTLGIDPVVIDNVGKPGLILAVGGRRTEIVHGFVKHYNKTQQGVVWLLEQNIAFLHKDDRALVVHREIGQDVSDYASGIRQSRIAPPNLLVIDDVSSTEVAEELLVAAENGVSVIAGLTAPSFNDAQWCFVRYFTGEARKDAEIRLRRVLRVVAESGS